MALCHSQLCVLGYMPLVCYENGAKPCRAQSWGPWQHSKAEQGRLWVQAGRVHAQYWGN